MDCRSDLLRRIRDGELTVSRAAEIADASVWEVAELAEDENIAWISETHFDGDLREL